MATAADSASNNHSPRSSGFSGDGLNSPQLRRNTRNLSSPWSDIVRGESEAVPATPSSSTAITPQEQIPDSDCSPVKASSSLSPDISAVEVRPESSDNGNSNVARAKKPAWNNPSNGVIIEAGPVMGAVSWPALSETTRATPKSSSDSSKALSVAQGPVIPSSPHKQVTNTANPNSTPNHAFPVRQKSMKRGGGGGGPANGGFSQPSPPPPSVVEMPQNSSGKPGSIVPDSSPRDPPHKSNNWESGPRGGFMSQSHIGTDHPPQRNSSFRRGNGGSHPRGDGPYHNNYSGRRDQDRPNQEWNSHRSFNGRDVHMQQQQQRVVQRNIIRAPPPNTGTFITPPHIRPFGNPMGFPDMPSPVYILPAPPHESLRGVPYVHAAHPALFFPAPDPQLRSVLAKQIDYYFSSENLCKDIYLRQNMDEQGWVPISLIANFNRVKQLTNNIQYILDAVRTSTVVEVQGDKIRKRSDWMTWPLLSSSQSASVPGPQSPGISNYDMLANQIQSVGLEEVNAANHNSMSRADPRTEAVLTRSSSGELNGQSQASTGEGTGQDTVQAGSDRSILTRSESC